MKIVKVNDLSKEYTGKVPHTALSNIDLTITEGEFVGIMGPSGSGKTTLLNMISTIDSPTSGSVCIHNQNLYHLSPDDLALFRRKELGFVFQSFNLLHTLTVKENMVLPLVLDGIDVKRINKRVESISEKLGINEILNKRTYEISGGQAQRTAIARALIHSPKLVLADEPTGNLDSKASQDVMDILSLLNKEEKATMMLVTHDPVAASYCDRIIFIKDGQLYNEVTYKDNRPLFYKKIMDSLSMLRGNKHDFSTTRI
ncbi:MULTISPECIES: ABC transporter ATP-binding protein [Bacillus cereus group]|uniref:ABC transporter ATP-binding protein n=1 Tax=Bacillus cereus group TaxID=86661 RepID=UPI0007B6A365|nr:MULTISPECIES: ABC transporter ATP-binding protein [Bacillus cereus group]ANC22734.1 bacitracin ABC transporter ATP-binding protein [Bacillus cereus]HDR8043023.1 ABC transporter ATP-binding protein [Bacillus cereus]HDR8043658.1 ABC transporter ATP-binding protein [Bacillus cereus]HEF1897965.1 ABC transporter ATP-binding protein [Bacillus cereus]HEF1900729.1 ABC transporter ATP-binding protein [Bacillus cereus]